ncbi:6-cysteine protein [Plasmodium vivax]|uniref:6-cysteine protein n=1 Tax=Plasmodium vivax TaxID=5855 RepID=A0A1G4GRT1_PLAVI|nr:6-cysteine protein [Plasmodium vivax]
MRRILLGCLAACLLGKWASLCRKINDLISIGHVNVCSIDMMIEDAQECVLENEFGKAFLFICNSGDNLSYKSGAIPETCAHRTFINLSDPSEFSADSNTYELFQNLIGANNSTLQGHFLFFSTPYSNKDIDLSCLCLGESQKKIKHVMKLVFKKTKKKIKGCDFGYNILSSRDLTNNIDLNKNAACVIHAYPGDVIGINCYKKESNHSYNDQLELVPNNCFHSVHYGNDIILSTNNLIPNSRVIPDATADVKLSKMHSYMSYMILPKDMTMTGKISCYCKRGEHVGYMFIYLKTVNNLLLDSNNGIDRIIERGNGQESSDEEWAGSARNAGVHSDKGKSQHEAKTDVKQHSERAEDIHNHYNNINSIYYNTGMSHPSRRPDYQGQSHHRNEVKKSSVSESTNESNTYSYSIDKNVSRENPGNKLFNENNYDAYDIGVGAGFSRGPQRGKKRTFWQNLFGLSSSSQFASFNSLMLSFLVLIYAGFSSL